jgi:hypothetical protein
MLRSVRSGNNSSDAHAGPPNWPTSLAPTVCGILRRVFRELLEELLSDTGADYCCVADAALGKVLDERGIEAPGERMSLAVLGWSATAAGFLAAAAADDLEDLIVTSRAAHHLVRQVGASSARPLLIYVRLDRRRGTLAAARRELAAVRLDRTRPATVPAPRASSVSAGQMRVLARAAPPVAVPLPRRQPAALPVQRQVPVEAAPLTSMGPAPPGGQWRTDTATMRRLLRALQNLR